MFEHLKHWLVPHEGNAYKPLLVRAGSIAALSALSIALFFGAAYFENAIKSGNLAAVISSVLVDLTNTDRAENQLGTLSVNDKLVAAAQMKANDMAAKGYFAHTAPDGTTPWHWFDEAVYRFEYAGENLAVYFTDSADVERAWMNSPSHRANILNGHFTEIGIATAQGTYEGHPTVFVVQEFGSPATVKPAKQPTAQVTLETTPVVKAAPEVTGTSTTSPAVEGSSLQKEDQVRTIVSDETFIAVKNDAKVASTADAAATTSAVSVWDRLMASPKTVLHGIYLVLAILLGFAIALAVGIELKRQHLPSVVLPVILIVLIAALIYVNYAFVLGGNVLVR